MFNFKGFRGISYMIPVITIGGGVLAAVIWGFLSKFVKYEFDIKGAIRLEKKRWTNDTWEGIFKKAGVSKDKYHITEPKTDWRYE